MSARCIDSQASDLAVVGLTTACRLVLMGLRGSSRGIGTCRAVGLKPLGVALAAAVLALGAAGSVVRSAVSSRLAGVKLTVVATSLNSPRKISLGQDGTIYVAEAGTGGSDKCFGTGPSAICVGLSGSITRIAHGKQSRVVTGLASWATPAQRDANGPAAVLVRGGAYYILLQDSAINSKGVNPLGSDGAVAGDLIATPGGRALPKLVANLAAFEATHNPDHGAGPGPRFGNPSVDSDPYAFTPYRGGFAVADAGANDLLWISPKGTISLLAVFPTQTVRLSKAVAKEIGAPVAMRSISMQSVPSCVVVGPDGALYVGELTGRPFPPGKARIWRIVPGRKPAVYASGFTNISDLAFDGRNLLVLEIAARGLLDPRSSGALIQLAPGGARTVLASSGLVYPTGLAIGNDRIYISNYGVFPGTGAGSHGEIVSLPAAGS
jgi:hypothetical protein